MTSRAQELAKMLGRTSVTQPTTFMNRSSYVRNSYTGEGTSGWSIIYGIGLTLLVLFIILVIVHYSIKPIFPENVWPWMKNIPLIGPKSDSQLVWTKEPAMASKAAGFDKLIPNGFTIQMDVYVKAANSVGKVSRVFLYRASQPVTVNMNPQVEDLINTYSQTNLFMYLAPDTNDLSVSVITGTEGDFKIESAPTLLNVPVGQSFRVTTVLFPNLLEVYFNGRLFGTKTLKGTPRLTIADFYGPPDGIRDTVQIMNLVYWDRTLDAREIAQTYPAIPDPSLFGPIVGAMCPGLTDAISGTIDTVSNTVSSTVTGYVDQAQEALGSLPPA